MGILSRAADLGYAFRFLKLLTTPWNKLKAFELGIVDEKGKKGFKSQGNYFGPFRSYIFDLLTEESQ